MYTLNISHINVICLILVPLLLLLLLLLTTKSHLHLLSFTLPCLVFVLRVIKLFNYFLLLLFLLSSSPLNRDCFLLYFHVALR